MPGRINTKVKLNYVFELTFRSVINPDGWVTRSLAPIRQSNECKSTPYQLAGNIAAHYLKPAERGVRVRFLGLQEDGDWNGPITPMNPFTLTLIRDL